MHVSYFARIKVLFIGLSLPKKTCRESNVLSKKYIKRAQIVFFLLSLLFFHIMTDTPPPEDTSAHQIEYKKKARHGHNNDVTDVHNIRQVAGCLPIDPYTKRFLLISSSKNPEQWVIVNYHFKSCSYSNI